jgi:hypothetical protein
MSTRTQRILLWIALIATAPFLLITGLWCLFLFNSVNPMQAAFISEFKIENRTQLLIWVTPIGTRNDGSKHVLPQFSRILPAIPASDSRDLQIDAGKTRSIYYDWDDINFSDIAIRDTVGTLRTLVVDPAPPTTSYYANKQNLYPIEDLSALPVATSAVVAAVAPRPSSFSLWPFAIIGVMAPLIFLWLWRKLRAYQLTTNTNRAHAQET